MPFIDTHAHLFSSKFDKDSDTVIEQMLAANVNMALLPNIDTSSIEAMFDLYARYPEYLRAMVGLHPCSVKGDYKQSLQAIEPYINRPGVVAIGEMGIDLYWDKTFQKEQIDAFTIQAQWAKAHQLPIVIHSRDAIDITVSLVEELQDGNLRGVFHCFGEDLSLAKRIIDQGFYMGIGGSATFKSNHAFRSTLADIPLDRIVLETDAPYLAPHPHRGKRNESAYIPIIAQTVADSHNVALSTVEEITTQNAKKLFQL